jgi:hypothetical protein
MLKLHESFLKVLRLSAAFDVAETFSSFYRGASCLKSPRSLVFKFPKDSIQSHQAWRINKYTNNMNMIESSSYFLPYTILSKRVNHKVQHHR